MPLPELSSGLAQDSDAEAMTRQLRDDLALMKRYLQMCVRKEDWHGVMDASADIREIVAKLSMLSIRTGGTLPTDCPERPLAAIHPLHPTPREAST